MISLWVAIGILLLFAIMFIILSKQSKKITLGLFLLVIFASLIMYYFIGNSQGLRNAQLLQAFNTDSEQGIDRPDLLQELIAGLQTQLKHHPDDPMTLALLGKIYFTLGDYHNASDIFAKAYVLLPEDPDLLIDYTSAYFLANNGVVDPQLEVLLAKIKQLQPTLESLGLLANVAFTTGDTLSAISYWQQMQAQLPKDSELYRELDLTIEFARDN